MSADEALKGTGVMGALSPSTGILNVSLAAATGKELDQTCARKKAYVNVGKMDSVHAR